MTVLRNGTRTATKSLTCFMRWDVKSARSNEAAYECEKKTGDNENSTQRSSQHPFISIVEAALLRRPKSALVETSPLAATQR